jgi:TolB-like protein
MSCSIEGYNYDIFISYRQKDNKYDGWVTEFVENLKKELEATFKEEISVYFDINPHDGLLETHDVDASLKVKLKCLIFIPIISKTYCDPNSFAWENELKAFAELALNDRLGLMVKLLNGNVASRILPVRIHEITECDVKLFETITGSFLRGIDFIYKEPGVNRPLRSNEENPSGNLNHTFYRNQVNKVSNAIQELIMAIQSPGQRSDGNPPKELISKSVSGKKSILKYITGAIIAIILIIAGIIFFPKLINKDNERENSIAVLPFYSMSADTSNQYLADGMMDAILTHLSKINDLRVMSRTSVEQYRKTKKTTAQIGKELDVKYILEGSFQKAGDSIRLIAQLIRVGKEGHVWSDIYDRLWKNVFSVQSEVAKKIASELKGVLTPEEIEKIAEIPTENLDAYQAYLRGRYYTDQPHFSQKDWNEALSAFQEAEGIDTTFALACAELAKAHGRLVFLSLDPSDSRKETANTYAIKALRLGPDQPRVQIAIGYYYFYAQRDIAQALKYLDIAEKNLPNDFDIFSAKAEIYLATGKWDEHLYFLEKALVLNPRSSSGLTDLAKYYWLTRRYKEAIDAANKSIAISPGGMNQYLFKAWSYWCWKGPGKESLETLKAAPNLYEWWLWSWYWQEVGEGDLGTALKIVDTTKAWGVDNKGFAIPKNSLLATIYKYQGKDELALENYKIAAAIMEEKVTKNQNKRQYHSALGIAYAGMGKKEEAIAEGQKAVRMLPLKKDALYGIPPMNDLAIIYTMVGDYDSALMQLDTLLTRPSWITPAWIDFDIRFAPLKSLPAFKKLMTKYSVRN